MARFKTRPVFVEVLTYDELVKWASEQPGARTGMGAPGNFEYRGRRFDFRGRGEYLMHDIRTGVFILNRDAVVVFPEDLNEGAFTMETRAFHRTYETAE